MRHSIAATMLALAITSAVPAGGQRLGTACNISAFVTDRDPSGLNVRAGPSTVAPVLRVISNNGSAVARISGQQGLWFRVSSIVNAEDESSLFQGDG